MICLCISSFTIHAEEITCYPHPYQAPIQEKTLSEKIDASFGGIVERMVAVLFWNPFAFSITDEQGKPLLEPVKAKNKQGQTLAIVSIPIGKKMGGETIVHHLDACLDAKGNFQFNQSGYPWLTHWKLEQGNFVHDKPYFPADSFPVYLADEQRSIDREHRYLESLKPKTSGIPLVVLLLLFAGIFYTIWYKFINFRLFKHAIDCIRGIYDNPKDPGEISHFQALTAALSATVGLGNIAGVAVAIGLGGPGAVFWMMLLGFLGMTSKFHECTLGQMYRWIDSQGRVHGGPKYYLDRGLNELGYKSLGKILAGIFAIFCVGGSLGGGNMFQANQSFKAISGELTKFKWFADFQYLDWAIGIVLAILVGLVILGGIRRIGNVTAKLVPLMVFIYVGACLYIIMMHFTQLPAVFKLVFAEAFNLQAGVGGFVGVMVQGIKRAVFSNEAGIGSAAIAHAAAKTEEPIREGIVALLEPFIDTVVICAMSAFVLIVTGAYAHPDAGQGVEMMRFAFHSKLAWFPTILSLSVFFFAYSTMISWSYYGEKAWTYLFGHSSGSVNTYKIIFLICIVLGTVSSLDNVITFSDLMILAMAFPNILGGIWLAKKVRRALQEYMAKLKAGKFQRYGNH